MATRKRPRPKAGPNRMGKGQGSLFQVERSGRTYWRGQVQAGHLPSGKRRYLTVTRRTKHEVLAEMDNLRRRAGLGVAGRDLAVGDLVDEYVEQVKAPTIAASSLAEYRNRVKRLRRYAIAGRPVRKLTARDVREWLAAMEADGTAANTANHAKSTLSSALAWAVDEHRVERNVAENVRGITGAAKLDDGLHKDEADRVLAAASDDRLYALLYIAITLGLRQSETLSLRWSDVDLDRGELRVDQSKTRSGERSLPLVASTLDTLREHRRRQTAERLEAATWHDNDLVFCQPDGRPIAARDLVRWWHALQETAKVERRRWHALRHSAAERMLTAGVPLELVSVVLGHSGLAITADVYSRWTADAKRRELGRYLDDNGTET